MVAASVPSHQVVSFLSAPSLVQISASFFATLSLPAREMHHTCMRRDVYCVDALMVTQHGICA